jgi:outer membrane protein assembly factor BamB
MKKSIKFSLLIPLFSLLATFNFTSCGLLDHDKMDDPKVMVGDTLWVHNMVGSDSLFTAGSMAIGQDGAIYYAKSGGTLYWTAARIVALDKDSGNQLWESEPIDNIELPGNIVVGDDGTVYVIGHYKLYAFNHTNGSLKWIWEVPTELPNPNGPGNIFTYGQIGRLALLNDGSLILGSIGSGIYNRALYSVSIDGNTKWYNIGAVAGGIGSNIVIGKNNNIFYYSSFEGKYNLFAVNGATGDILWHKEIISYGSTENNIVLKENGDLICSFALTGDEKYYLYTIDPNNGNVLKKSITPSNANTKLIGPNGNIYQQGDEYAILNYDENTGLASRFSEEAKVTLRPAIINSMGQIIVVNTIDFKGHISTFNADGMLDWTATFDGVKNYSLLLSNDEVIIGNTNNKVFAIKANSKIANNGWPMKTHDTKNSNNLNK